MTRPSAKSMLRGLVLLASGLALLGGQRTAAALTCMAPPAFRLASPVGRVAPPMPTFLVHLSSPTKFRPYLVALPGKRRVALHRVAGRATGMVLWRPRSKLAVGAYRFRMGNLAYRFRVESTASAGSATPPRLAARLSVSPAKPGRLWLSAGRALTLHSRSTGIAAVEIALETWTRAASGRSRHVHARLALPFAPTVDIAKPTMCAWLPNAPVRGRFRVTITPWSARGVAGKALEFAGKLVTGDVHALP